MEKTWRCSCFHVPYQYITCPRIHCWPDLFCRSLDLYTQSCVRQHLVEESIAADKPLKEFLGWLEAGNDYLQDILWFKKYWPEDIQMRCTMCSCMQNVFSRLSFSHRSQVILPWYVDQPVHFSFISRIQV